MATIICKQCGYENPEGTTVCEICAEPLVASKVTPVAPVQVEQVMPSYSNEITTEQQSNTPIAHGDTEFFVMCPESSTKTIVSSGDITSYYCTGCQKEHIIDNFLWTVESRALNAVTSTAPVTAQQVKMNNLWLEEVNTHHRIDICKPGGTLGRYGDFGADYFQSRAMNTVSGEHCLIRFELENWVLYHVSRTNQTKYNGMILSSNEPTLLENGKMLTLANTVSFIVRID